MTENVNDFTKATATLQNKTHGAGYKKGIAAVNLAAAFAKRGVNVHSNGQNEK